MIDLPQAFVLGRNKSGSRIMQSCRGLEQTYLCHINRFQMATSPTHQNQRALIYTIDHNPLYMRS
jgi:hypothetical protein